MREALYRAVEIAYGMIHKAYIEPETPVRYSGSQGMVRCVWVVRKRRGSTQAEPRAANMMPRSVVKPARHEPAPGRA